MVIFQSKFCLDFFLKALDQTGTALELTRIVKLCPSLLGYSELGAIELNSSSRGNPFPTAGWACKCRSPHWHQAGLGDGGGTYVSSFFSLCGFRLWILERLAGLWPLGSLNCILVFTLLPVQGFVWWGICCSEEGTEALVLPGVWQCAGPGRAQPGLKPQPC